jgi:L-threonylcarbamoyladenylate synthase
LLEQLSFPLAAPSANPFGYISPTNARHVMDQLGSKIPYILDGGPAFVGVESTIVGFEDNMATIHRLGGLAVEDLEKVIGKVKLNIQASSNPQAPGMLKSHYAPRKPLLFGVAAFEEVLKSKKKKIGVIAFDKYVDGVDEESQILLSPRNDLNEAAKNLFAAMRTLDAADVDLIYAVEFPNRGLGLAINDRLKRAAS